MGATLAGLEARGLFRRAADPHDGRRVVLSITPAGLYAMRMVRSARTEQLAAALADGFTQGELKRLLEAAPLIERLAQSL
jgi:DNA-binding MarR family transcriptional regulator